MERDDDFRVPLITIYVDDDVWTIDIDPIEDVTLPPWEELEPMITGWANELGLWGDDREEFLAVAEADHRCAQLRLNQRQGAIAA